MQQPPRVFGPPIQPVDKEDLMPNPFKRRLLGSASVTLAAALALGAPSVPAHAASTTAGSATAVTFYLPLRNASGAEAAARAIQTPGSATYHQFLTLAQFKKAYAPTNATITEVESVLAQLGYTVTYVFANNLAIQATAPSSTVESTLGLQLRTATLNGRSGIVPSRAATLPPQLVGLVRNIGGLDTLHVPHPMSRHAAVVTPAMQASKQSANAALTGGTPGNYLPADFASRYDVDPIYASGVNGRGTTIGIVTLANFYPSDAYTFWKDIGLKVSQSRITVVDVDGGTSLTPSDAAGEGETDLDVEESGGLAPGAKERVYISQNNTNANFIDGFEAAASDNIADTVSTSWGQPELEFFAGVGQTDTTAQIDDFHEVFLEMALQGQSIFVASGDSGSFDTVEGCPTTGTPSAKNPVCNAPYAVDSPSNDPLVTAAGGTTTPFTAELTDGATLSVTTERAWSWDYIAEEDPAIPVSGVFSTGDGGGVSSYFAKPWYQVGVPGITATVPNQSFTENTGSGPVTILTLPSGFAGRNMPDVSTDADPESGYQFIEEGAVQNFYGGTSFVAPQLNGVNALFNEALGKRTGQINPALYAFGRDYIPDVTAGDNWGYNAVPGFDNASGVGKLDAAQALLGLATLQAGL